MENAPLPRFVPPALATLREVPPNGPDWEHEIKFDGYRIQARLNHGKLRLLTRKGLDWTDKFPNVAAAVAQLPAETALIDGEVVVEDKHGVSDFSLLQAAIKDGSRDRFVYHVFDLLYRDGRDLRALPLRERRDELAQLLAKRAGGVIRFSENFGKDGPLALRKACRLKLEGIVSKQIDAPYRSGRSEAFIKTKCSHAQELVVGGYSPSKALVRAIGALAVGYYDRGRLIYAGRIGTGYSRDVAKELWRRLHPLEIATPPFASLPDSKARRGDMRWVKPSLVVESNLRGWTADGLVRQAAFKGVREDKPAKEVVRESPVESARREAHGEEN